MDKKITTYVVCVARSKFKKLFKVIIFSYLLIILAIRFMGIPHKAEVRMVTNIPPTQLLVNQSASLENLTGGALFSLDRDTFIASQEVLLNSLPLYEMVEKKAEVDIVDIGAAAKGTTSTAGKIKKFFQTILFGSEYTANLGLWKNQDYTKFKSKVSFTARPDDGSFMVGYVDVDPLKAIQIASYITESLIELNVKMAKDESTEIANFLRQRLETAKAASQEASMNLANFLKESNLPSDAFSLRDRYNLYVNALKEDDNSTRARVRSEARLAELENVIKSLEDMLNRNVLTGTDIKVDSLLTELRRVESAGAKHKHMSEDRGVASDYFSEQMDSLKQGIANEIAKYGSYIPVKDLLDLLAKNRVDLAKQRQTYAEDKQYDQLTAKILSKYEAEIQKYPEFQTKLNALLAEINQKTKIVDLINQEYLRYCVKSESKVSRIYALQKPMIVSGFFNSGKFMTVISLLCIATLIVPILSALYHLLNGTIFSKYQIMRRSDIRFVGVFPSVPSITKDALTQFCSSSEPIFRIALETAHSLPQRHLNPNAKTLAMASATPGNGTSVCTFGVSKGLGRLRHSVLVIDCDFLSSASSDGIKQSGVTRFFVDNPEAESLLDDVDSLLAKLTSTTSPAKQQGITFVKMVKGTIEQNVYVEVLKDKFTQQIDQLRQYYDYIILDGPALSVTEGLMIIEQADAVLLCCPEGNMSEAEFNQALSVVNQHRKPDSTLLSVLTNSKIPENVSLEDNYSTIARAS